MRAATLGILILATGNGADVRIAGLRCEVRINPLGIDVAKPRLSWIIESDARGERQSAYQVLVARRPEDLEKGDLWDSGKIASDRSVHVAYEGKPLRSGERAWWKVRVWTSSGATAVSEPAWWEAGLTDWTAKWIGFRTGEEEAPVSLDTAHLRWIWFPEGNPAQSAPSETRHFKKSFTVPEGRTVKRAFVIFTADNSFVLSLDGKKIQEGADWTSFQITELKSLAAGNHDLSITAANGGGPAGLIGQVRVEFETGDPLLVSTDATWASSKKKDGEWEPAKELGKPGDGPWTQVNGKSLTTGRKEPASYLRKSFSLNDNVRRARLHVTALGLFEASINGKRVGKDYFAPGWTDYNKRVQVQTYDVTDLLLKGENAIGFILGDGWYAGNIGWSRKRQHYGPLPLRLLAQLEVELSDGSKRTVATDESWKGSSGPIVEADIYDGETYDARLEQPGWDCPAFSEKGWRAVKVLDEKRNLVSACGPAVQVMHRLDPVTVKEHKPGVFIYDMGQNMVGWVRLKARGAAGTEVTLRFAEMLNPDGSIYTTNLRAAKCTDRYILKGGGDEAYEPRFTFHGFRYVEITGYPGKPDLGTITGCVAYSAAPASGWFECSSKMINKLQSNIVWGQRGNFLEVPTDCPQRDERLGWMGDAQIFVRTACFNMDVAAFFTKWMLDVEDGQTAEGSFCDVSPRVLLEGDGSPAWADAGLIVPWAVYESYADTRLLERHYPSMKKYVDFIKKNNPDLLWTKRVGNNYGDWVAIGSNTPKDVLATAYFAQSARLLSGMARVLGRGDDAKTYEDLFQSIKAAFIKAYVSDDGRIKGDTQTCYLLALRFDLLPENLRESAAKRLVADIEKHKGHLTTGFLGVGHLLPALSEAGQLDTAYHLLNNESFPSWGFSIKHGATTIWERWDGWTPEKGFQDPGMNSFNHYSFGSVGEWMYRTVAGLAPDINEPGYKHILIRPQPGGGLNYARAEYDSVYGKVVSAWSISDGEFILQVTVPVNATATVTVPGKDAVESEGAKPVKPGVFEIGSGKYRFKSKW